MSEAAERPVYTGVRFSSERDFDVFSSGLIALFDKNLIDRGEVRTALREWGLSLDDRDALVGLNPVDKHGLVKQYDRREFYARRFMSVDPSEWSRIVEEYYKREVGPV